MKTTATTKFAAAALLAAGLLAGCATDGSDGYDSYDSASPSNGSSSRQPVFTSKDIQDLTGAIVGEVTDNPEEGKKWAGVAGQLAGTAAPVTPEVEQRLGEGIAVKAYATEGKRHPDEDLQRYVNLVGRAVSRQSGRPDLLYSFAVIESDAPNAFAGPGGYIFVTTAALKLMRSEAELAGVLAHEIAHVTERHMLTIYRKQQRFDTIFATAEAIDGDAARYGDAVNFGTDTLFNKGLGAQFEFGADTVGMEYAALAGYDPEGLVTFLERLGQGQTAQPGGWLASTHPSTAQRVGRCRQYLSTTLSGVEGKQLAERFAKYTAGVQ